jgi:hypothetical protein
MSNTPAASPANTVRAAPARWLRVAGLLSAVMLVAGCGGDSSNTGGGDPPPPQQAPAAEPCRDPVVAAGAVTLFGTAQYESVPPNPNGIGLDYTRATPKPIRGATAELLNAAGSVLASCSTSEAGNYSFTFFGLSGDVRLRVRAESRKTTAEGGQWDFSVRDNTGSGTPLYVLDSPLFAAQAAQVQERNLLAGTGFDGTRYSGVRAAAPFAILDVAFEAAQKVLGASPDLSFPPLNLMWSANNIGVGGDLGQGQIGATHYEFSANGHEIFVLGDEDADTDEFDRHVVAAAWGRYFQTVFSRDDSPEIDLAVFGGKFDMRLAFSEGWGNAFAGMVLGSANYTDAQGPGQSGGFFIDLAEPPADADRGWFSEASVRFLLWNFHEDAAIGFAPIFGVMAGTLPASDSYATIHNFATLLKARVPAAAANIDALLRSQDISPQDAQGTGETNDGGLPLALPLYQGVNSRVCVTDELGVPIVLGNRAFMRFNASGRRTLVVTVDGQTDSDPDVDLILSDGSRIGGASGSPVEERLENIDLPPGNHLVELFDFNMLFQSAGARGPRCFNVSLQ